ncbi:MAG: right-handed parallel beta-helix repeat-containing protein [Bacteroidota bacterium]
MKTINFILIVVALLTATFFTFDNLHATTYYISGGPLGNDANNGISSSTPWRTIDKLNTVQLQPGDLILFERGWIYTGEISADTGVYYGAYGNGSSPVISGAVQLSNTGWSNYQGFIYVLNNVNMPPMSDAEPPNLFVNGKLMIPARYPNSDYLKADTVYGQNPGSSQEYSLSLQHSYLSRIFPNPADLQGAHITAYDSYGVSTRLITGYNPAAASLSFDTLRGVKFINSKIYFLSRKLTFLDSAGEWYYDEVAKKLYLWLPNSSAPNANDIIEYSSYSFGINAWQVPYITVKDLEFRYQQIASIYITRADGVEISNNSFYGAKYGILGWGGPGDYLVGTKIKNNVFENIHRVAICLKDYIESALITENVIHNISLNNALMQSGKADWWSNYGYYEYGIGIQAGRWGHPKEPTPLFLLTESTALVGKPFQQVVMV